MAETKNWTPGPWAIDGWHTSAVIAKLPDESYVRVADCDTPSFPNLDWKANAHLIAAAPALYEALKAIADALVCNAHKGDDSAHYCPNCDNSFHRIRDAARAALALAEGKQ